MLRSTGRRYSTIRSVLPAKKTITARQFRTSIRLSSDGGAFDPKTTKPENQKAGGQNSETGTNPVDPTANRATDPQEGGGQGSPAENGQGSSTREGQSGGGSPPKAGKEKGGS